MKHPFEELHMSAEDLITHNKLVVVERFTVKYEVKAKSKQVNKKT